MRQFASSSILNPAPPRVRVYNSHADTLSSSSERFAKCVYLSVYARPFLRYQ